MTLLPVHLLILICAQLASTQPAISFPFNSQLPPAARIDKFFSYSLAPSTFTSSRRNISYSLGDHPDWLSIESDGRRLYGTPKEADVPPGDVVGQSVDIIAKDDTGETAMKATLVVARKPPPEIHIPMAKQIGSFGKFSAPSSILSYPMADIKFSFDPKTFGNQDLNYYATSGDGSPLPAWVHFDAPSMTFSGKTPPFKSLVQPPQAFDLNLVASDIVGFAAASLSFSVVVGSHKLTTDLPIISLNASRGAELKYSGLENGIQIDGKPVAPGELKVTTDGLPGWLTYDPDTLRLKGTPGKEDHSTNLTISFHDPFSDTLDVHVEIHVASSLFESTLDDMKLQPGSFFELDLAKHFRNPGDLKVDVTTSPHEDWLKVDGLKMSGNVPKSAKGDIKISIDARSGSSGIKETEAFDISFLAVDGTTAVPKKPTSPTPTSTPDSHAASADSSDAQTGHLSTGEILLATIIPIIFITILLMLLICYVRRRRARRTYLSSKYLAKMANPMAPSLDADSSEPSMREMEGVGGAAYVGTHSSKPVPLAHLENISQSSRGRSSDTLSRLSDAEMPQSLLTDDATTASMRSIDDSSDDSSDDRQSWVTVEGEDTGLAGGSHNLARRSHKSDTTFPESTHQLLPTPDIFAEARRTDFRSGLDVTIPTIEDLPAAQEPPSTIYKQSHYYRPSLGAHSNMTTSSVALPSVLERNYRWHARNDPSMSNWETIAESDTGESVSEVRRPDKALLSQKQDDSRNWYYRGSSTGSKSLGTDISFESTENWRVIGGPRSVVGPHQSYRDLIDDAPFHPSQAGTARDGARPGERSSPKPLSPGGWRDKANATARRGPSASLATVQSGPDTEATMSGGRGDAGDGSGHVMSEGSDSFKVFL
ncbi:hypothetical protein G6O67_001000 [Ophiocordyceps sinensis]|uniref:Dystroglycan-type cadherin-like domain-containing protein n=2 Tax=Ophiocordyceps sinensis TaxID=72228 RepID=A0A8H4V8R9_9HYPO|nr:Cadherin-like protein [Ophiocordyceps sinensis CO18]KAF4511790.1 hypothetical protein G6O67_001000 [Ophiocordyceps sinensis]